VGKQVYLNNIDLEAYELMRSLFQACTEGGSVWAETEEEHQRLVCNVGKLSEKIGYFISENK